MLGTRAAVFAPVADLGLVAIWDDGDDLHAEPRAPYAHARDVLVHRAYLAGCAAVVAGTARTAEAALLVETGWAHELAADRAALRAAARGSQAAGRGLRAGPRPRGPHRPAAQSAAHRVARQALADGAPGAGAGAPVRATRPALSCARCRAPARCAACAGSAGHLAAVPGPGGSRVPACRWCARPAATFDCPHCHGTKLRAVGRRGPRGPPRSSAGPFPGPRCGSSGRSSGRAGRRCRRARAIVVATPGAEPVAEGGYGAALLLDSWALLGRADLRAGEETLRRWMNAAALVRPAVGGRPGGGRGGRGASRRPGAGALGPGLAGRAGAGRPARARLPAGHPDGLRCPASPAALAEFLEALRLPDGRRPARPGARAAAARPGRRAGALPRAGAARPRALALAHALAEVQGVRSAKKVAEHVRVQLDPLDLVWIRTPLPPPLAARGGALQGGRIRSSGERHPDPAVRRPRAAHPGGPRRSTSTRSCASSSPT